MVGVGNGPAVSSTSGSSNLLLSPVSDSTLVNAPFPSHMQALKLPPPEGALPPFDRSAALLQLGFYRDARQQGRPLQCTGTKSSGPIKFFK